MKTAKKIFEERARKRHLKWINHYSNRNFGIWIECHRCKKWRKTYEYTESHEVPKIWYCSMQSLESGNDGNCNYPEEKNEDDCFEYYPGALVWAKMKGYPWWPGMVDGDPITDEYIWVEEDGSKFYNVTFLDKKPTHAWISPKYLCRFLETPKGYPQNLKQSKHARAIQKAEDVAKLAMKMKIKDRLQTYSFVFTYKGPWPIVPGFEESDDEENECADEEETSTIENRVDTPFNNSDDEETSTIENKIDTPFNNSDDEETVNSTSSDDKEDFCEDVMQENSELSSSDDHQSFTQSEEDVASPHQETHNKGIKRKKNGKLTDREEKKRANSFNRWANINNDEGNSDSEYERYFPEVRNHENFKSKNKKNYIKSLNGKVHTKKTNVSSKKYSYSSHLSSATKEILQHGDKSDVGGRKNIKNKTVKLFDECKNFEQKEEVKKIIKAPYNMKKKGIKQNKRQKRKNDNF